MAREISARVRLRAVLRVESPLHIGATAVPVGAQRPVCRDARGRPIIPGTSIAGALRAALHEAGPGDTWGGVAKGLGASRVTVHDAPLHMQQSGGPEASSSTRDGVAIDRALGSAVDGLLYSREVVLAGTWATVLIEVESSADTEPTDRHLLGRLRAILLAGLRLGARTNRGLGLLRAEQCTITEVRYDSAASYWRTRRKPATIPTAQLQPAEDGMVPDDGAVFVEFHWEPDGPIMVGTPGRRRSTRSEPLLEPCPRKPNVLRLVLPGTAIAGALRSHAELICRTVTRTDTPEEFAQQLTGAGLAAALFGLARGAGRSSAVLVDDCVSESIVDATRWSEHASRERHQQGEDAPASWPVHLPKAGAELVETDHVAVDRWTGGASEGRLFVDWEPHGFRFPPLRIRLHPAILDTAERDAATMLLLLTLRELAAGRVPLGGRGTRGHGRVRMTRLLITGGGLDIDAAEYPDLRGEEFAALRAAWRDWIEEASA